MKLNLNSWRCLTGFYIALLVAMVGPAAVGHNVRLLNIEQERWMPTEFMAPFNIRLFAEVKCVITPIAPQNNEYFVEGHTLGGAHTKSGEALVQLHTGRLQYVTMSTFGLYGTSANLSGVTYDHDTGLEIVKSCLIAANKLKG